MDIRQATRHSAGGIWLHQQGLLCQRLDSRDVSLAPGSVWLGQQEALEQQCAERPLSPAAAAGVPMQGLSC